MQECEQKRLMFQQKLLKLCKNPPLNSEESKLNEIYRNVDENWEETINDSIKPNKTSTQFLNPKSIFKSKTRELNLKSRLNNKNRSQSTNKRENYLININNRNNISNPRILFLDEEEKKLKPSQMTKYDNSKSSVINIQKSEKSVKEQERDNSKPKKTESGQIAFLTALINQREKTQDNTLERVCDLMKKATETKEIDVDETNDLISSMLQTLEVQDMMITKIDNDLKDMQDIRK